MTPAQQRKAEMEKRLNEKITQNKAYLQDLYNISGTYYNNADVYLTSVGGGDLLKSKAYYTSLEKIPSVDDVVDKLAKDYGYADNVRAKANMRVLLEQYKSKYKLPAYALDIMFRKSMDSNYWWKNVWDADTKLDANDDITYLDNEAKNYAKLFNKNYNTIEQMTNDFLKIKSASEQAESALLAANETHSANISKLHSMDNDDIPGIYSLNDNLNSLDHTNAITENIENTVKDTMAPFLAGMDGVSKELAFRNNLRQKAENTASKVNDPNNISLSEAYAYGSNPKRLKEIQDAQKANQLYNDAVGENDSNYQKLSLDYNKNPNNPEVHTNNTKQNNEPASILSKAVNRALLESQNPTSGSQQAQPQQAEVSQEPQVAFDPRYFTNSQLPYGNTPKVNSDLPTNMLAESLGINTDTDPALLNQAIKDTLQRRTNDKIAESIRNSMIQNVPNMKFDLESMRKFNEEQTVRDLQLEQERKMEAQKLLDSMSQNAGKTPGSNKYWM